MFSAGADLDEARAGLATDPVWERLSGRIAALPCLTIAGAERHAGRGGDGHGAGLRPADRGAGGEDLLSGDEARFPAAAFGSRAAGGAGRAVAGQADPDGGARVTVEEALGWGLVDRIVPPEALLPEAAALAADALAASAAHVAGIKRLVR